jgi:hypothetical protein
MPSGNFAMVQDKATGQYELEPAAAMGCKYHDFTRHDVFSCFHKRSDNAAVVMIGACLASHSCRGLATCVVSALCTLLLCTCVGTQTSGYILKMRR